MPKPTKNPGVIRFSAPIVGSNSGTFISFPYDLKELYGIGNLVPVIITFDKVSYQGSIAKMGGPAPMLLIKNSIREQIGKQPGEQVEVTVTLDTKPRIVEIPEELNKLLKTNPLVKETFDKLAFTHRREYAQWVASAKQPETRIRRAESAIEKIHSKAQNK